MLASLCAWYVVRNLQTTKKRKYFFRTSSILWKVPNWRWATQTSKKWTYFSNSCRTAGLLAAQEASKRERLFTDGDYTKESFVKNTASVLRFQKQTAVFLEHEVHKVQIWLSPHEQSAGLCEDQSHVLHDVQRASQTERGVPSAVVFQERCLFIPALTVVLHVHVPRLIAVHGWTKDKYINRRRWQLTEMDFSHKCS